jgi:hypothetical protein
VSFSGDCGDLTLLENHNENSNDGTFEQRPVGEQAEILMIFQFDFVHQTWSMVLGEPSERGFLLKAMLRFHLEIFQLHEIIVSGQIAQICNYF